MPDIIAVVLDPIPPIQFVILTVGTSSGASDLIEVVAAEDLPAYTMVTAQGNIADSNNMSHYGKVVGMTVTNVSAGNLAALADDDEVVNGLWSWSPGSKLYLNGTTVSNTPPSSGFSQRVATARNANILIIGLGPPVLL